MKEWRWLGSRIIYAVHDRQLAEHGGRDGIRDQGSVESALTRPQNLTLYGTPDVADLAAAYVYGLTKNHGFIDGNKQTAWIAARLFLADNGYRIRIDKVDAVRTVEAVAASRMSEAELASWFRDRIIK